MLIPFQGKRPRVESGAFVAPTAVLIGDVFVEAGASIWFGAVLRGDFGRIIIRRGSNVQDNAVLHTGEDHPTELEENVTIGHCAVLEGCHIGRGSVIGMNAVVLADVEIGEEVMVAAGSVIREHARIPSRVMVAGQPAEIRKELSGSSLNWIQIAAPGYRGLVPGYPAEWSLGDGLSPEGETHGPSVHDLQDPRP